MGKKYRPFTVARAGELAALTRIDAATRGTVHPVFQVPPRTWDYESERYEKTLEAHLQPLPGKFASAWSGGAGYVDLSLLDSETPIAGIHPLEWLVTETRTAGLVLTPLVRSNSSPSLKTAAAALHRSLGLGVGILLPQTDWTTIDPRPLVTLMADIGVTPEDVDIFVDFEGAEGAVIEVAVNAELTSLRTIGNFRSVTVGGAGYPDVTGVPRGTTEYPRKEWAIYGAVRAKRELIDESTPDFFDHMILAPDSIELAVDPRFISISATFRYTTAEKYLLAKGELFKGPGGTSKGGAALVAPLAELTRHAEYGTPIRSQADAWIEEVVAGISTPGNPQKWREWGTVRHVEVVAHQLASLT